MDQILAYVKSEGRICPRPDKWNQLYKMLPGAKRKGAGWDPPIPLILAAWWVTSESEKRARLELHIRYAHEKGVLEQISKFLHDLSGDQWFYESEVYRNPQGAETDSLQIPQGEHEMAR